VFVTNLGATRMNFIPHLPGGWLGTFCFLFSPAVFLAVTLVERIRQCVMRTRRC